MALGHWLKDYIGPHSGGSGGGSGAEPLIVNLSVTHEGQNTVYTMGKTWKEIRDAFPNVLIHDEFDGGEDWYSCAQIGVDEGFEKPYSVYYHAGSPCQTDSENGYPSFTDGSIG